MIGDSEKLPEFEVIKSVQSLQSSPVVPTNICDDSDFPSGKARVVEVVPPVLSIRIHRYLWEDPMT